MELSWSSNNEMEPMAGGGTSAFKTSLWLTSFLLLLLLLLELEVVLSVAFLGSSKTCSKFRSDPSPSNDTDGDIDDDGGSSPSLFRSAPSLELLLGLHSGWTSGKSR